MERHRTIHDKDRKSSYRIKLGVVSEDVHITINDEDNNVYFDKVIPAYRLNGVKDLHFKFIENKVEWDNPSANIVLF